MRRSGYASGEPLRTLGIAVDVGTTNIHWSVNSLVDSSLIAEHRLRNPQQEFGSDFMSRLLWAAQSEEHARLMSQMPTDAIGHALRAASLDMDFDVREIERLCIVGNTAMLALLNRIDAGCIIRTGHNCWPTLLEGSSVDNVDWASALDLASLTSTYVVPPLGRFIGSDLLAGVVSTSLMHDSAPSMLVDFGTNVEMALWDGRHLWVTSSAGGPAFDGSLCGSDLINQIADLVRAKAISERGQLRVGVSPYDVDLVQRGKAAVATGICSLLKSAGIHHESLKRVCISGVFGNSIDIRNAQAIGLLPEIDLKLIQLYRNTALAGCVQLMASPDAMYYINKVQSCVYIVDIENSPYFYDLFIDNLYFQRMRSE